ncbi:hypothetical protein DYB25_013265 [Aphanomyces astaci]|uniref:Uncharacterized protein n=1 Tax=Aphanomyces astaci TaxID=112090 RepID=A0A397BX56_APHAT|nr:hypothetical protein DYB25_013265 [Aphanomyces astaci]
MTYTDYVQGWLSYVALVIHFVVEKVWTSVGVPTPSSASAAPGKDDKDASHLLLGGGAYSRSSSSTLTPETSEDSTIVIIHHGSVAQFCGTPDVIEHGTMEEFCSPPPQNNEQLLEYIDGYVGWLTSPRQDNKHMRRVSTANKAKEFMQWLDCEPEADQPFVSDGKGTVASGSDNQEEPECDAFDLSKEEYGGVTAPWDAEAYNAA